MQKTMGQKNGALYGLLQQAGTGTQTKNETMNPLQHLNNNCFIH
jgi:hypothetical protein